MITRWKLSNFKSVRQETELAMGPLTIFAGSNSSGKSTLLQSILLVSQTPAAKVPSRSVILNGHLTRLGQFADVRSFGRTGRVTIGWELEPLPDGVQASLPRPSAPGRPPAIPPGHGRPLLKRISHEISLNVDSRGRQGGLGQLQPNLTRCEVACVSETRDRRTGHTANLTYHLAARRTGRSGRVPAENGSGTGAFHGGDEPGTHTPDYRVKLDRSSLDELREELASAEPVDCVFAHFLPDHLLVQFDEAEEEARLVASVICNEGLRYATRSTRFVEDRNIPIPTEVVDLLRKRLGRELIDAVLDPSSQTVLFPEEFPPTFTISDWQEGVRNLHARRRMLLRRRVHEVAQELGQEIQKTLKQGRDRQYNTRRQRLPGAISEAMRYSHRFFKDSVKYLGPLRDEPKPLYSLASTADPREVGLRGENTAAVLHLHKGLSVTYIPASNFSDSPVSAEPLTGTLGEAVLDWAHYLEVAQGIETADQGKLGHELRVSASDTDPLHDLTHVGVGVSQVLPILVMCLLADRDTVLVLEQPELHLHPRVQTRLADFFLSMSLLGKQCIVETHSEYLINRLRFRAASAPQDELSSSIRMYFVEKQEGNSTFREVRVNEYGAILDWPEGFFDQSHREAERILRAAVTKKKKEREGVRNA